MFCTNCGNKVAAHDKFCSSCGKEIKRNDHFVQSESSTAQQTSSRKNTEHQSPINSVYIVYGVILLVAYYIVLAMFVPAYGDVAPWLLVISVFLIDRWVFHKLRLFSYRLLLITQQPEYTPRPVG
ncbi:zinc-ribbon domain-containing protein [Bacillus sp. PS06]|uniref:zinc-ribbon domain-containing protein n=1 Tax=Bacillus sp. PS06 TaxID=2764176 RepID=UPI001783B01E|nr:zinc-ribbon domain-containing protein [Bacillus sp. PS06]MBD8069873.1 zinc-ribbon domain-containing protein [Bacillus sp. PS06]